MICERHFSRLHVLSHIPIEVESMLHVSLHALDVTIAAQWLHNWYAYAQESPVTAAHHQGSAWTMHIGHIQCHPSIEAKRINCTHSAGSVSCLCMNSLFMRRCERDDKFSYYRTQYAIVNDSSSRNSPVNLRQHSPIQPTSHQLFSVCLLRPSPTDFRPPSTANAANWF